MAVSAKCNSNSIQYVKERMRLLLDETSLETSSATALTTPHDENNTDAAIFKKKLEEQNTPVV